MFSIVLALIICLIHCVATDSAIIDTANSKNLVDVPAVENSLLDALCQLQFQMKCTEHDILLAFGIYATQKLLTTKKSSSIAEYPYFELEGHNVTEPGYIRLPDNISELNDYMCRSMNRKGLLCKNCIDGFGPSVTSLGYKCSNCTDAWYGIPLYLAVELIPITLFYLGSSLSLRFT